MYYHQLQINTVEKWFLTNPSIVQFDEKFQFFECAMEELLELPAIDSHFHLLIHSKPLIQSIKWHIEGWMEAYANSLFDSSTMALDELMDKLKVKSWLWLDVKSVTFKFLECFCWEF